jgi:hypothetical protein
MPVIRVIRVSSSAASFICSPSWRMPPRYGPGAWRFVQIVVIHVVRIEAHLPVPGRTTLGSGRARPAGAGFVQIEAQRACGQGGESRRWLDVDPDRSLSVECMTCCPHAGHRHRCPMSWRLVSMFTASVATIRPELVYQFRTASIERPASERAAYGNIADSRTIWAAGLMLQAAAS